VGIFVGARMAPEAESGSTTSAGSEKRGAAHRQAPVTIRRLETIEAFLGIVTLLAFVLYFGIHCFRYPWVGDLHRHVACVASLYRDFLHPSHEAMPIPGTQSDVHTPYIVAVAGVGKLLGVTPYRALQLIGVFNLVLYAWAVWFFSAPSRSCVEAGSPLLSSFSSACS
jgi:hypothetical protein